MGLVNFFFLGYNCVIGLFVFDEKVGCNMELNELEKTLDVTYPQKWHDIYKSGVMEWLKHDYDWLNKNRDDVESDPSSFFYALEGDCEPIPFCNISEEIEYLNEMFSWGLKGDDNKQSLNPHYKIIPFAKMGSGDVYCFLFDDREEQVLVVVCGHDTGDVDVWAKNFDEFLYLQMICAVTDWEQDPSEAAWQAHFVFLADEYKKKIQEQTMIYLEKEIRALRSSEKINIFLDIM